MKLKKNFRTQAFALLCLIAVCGGAAAFASRKPFEQNFRPEVKVNLSGLVERSGNHLSLDQAGPVNQGEILHWTMTSQNDGTGPARQYKAVGQIPKGTTLVAGSAIADGSVTVLYSIDEGKSFLPQPTVEEKQTDGSVKRVPAPVSMYTQVRYEWSDELVAGGKLSASYKVRVK